MMVGLLRITLTTFLQSKTVKLLILDLLRKLAAKTDNDVDDELCDHLANLLFPGVTPR